MPEIIDLVFAKTSPKRSSMTEYERFGLVFTKTRLYINSGTEVLRPESWPWVAPSIQYHSPLCIASPLHRSLTAIGHKKASSQPWFSDTVFKEEHGV